MKKWIIVIAIIIALPIVVLVGWNWAVEYFDLPPSRMGEMPTVVDSPDFRVYSQNNPNQSTLLLYTRRDVSFAPGEGYCLKTDQSVLFLGDYSFQIELPDGAVLETDFAEDICFDGYADPGTYEYTISYEGVPPGESFTQSGSQIFRAVVE